MPRGAFFHEGHDHEHDDFFHDDDAGSSTDGDDSFDVTWALDNVELTTVGVDVGSSTSHLLFAKLHLQRLTQSLSSRFVVVHREVLHRSPILLTPYRTDGLIDVQALERFVHGAHRLDLVALERFGPCKAGQGQLSTQHTHGREAVAINLERGGKVVVDPPRITLGVRVLADAHHRATRFEDAFRLGEKLAAV